ncbi:MAG: hypothetical protein IKM13_03550 [Clostridia bacterium]|nr:hypothetical protein [Clostridia bacterium]
MGNSFMDCGLIHKAKRFFATFFVVLLLSSILTSCHPIYPQEIATEWVCETPYVRLDTESPELEFCGEIIPINVGFLYDDYEVFPADSAWVESVLFSGEFRYSINKKKLIFTIDHDYLFDGKYKKLVFTPVPGTEVATK